MLRVFLEFVKIGFIAFGGGWSIIGIIKDAVLSNNWLTPEQFKEILSISQMTPGPVMLNTATYVGLKMYGITGAILNSIAVLVAPITFTTLFFIVRNRLPKEFITALKFGVIFLISITFISLLTNISSFYQILISIVAFLLFTRTKIDPIYVIFISGIIGFFLF